MFKNIFPNILLRNIELANKKKSMHSITSAGNLNSKVLILWRHKTNILDTWAMDIYNVKISTSKAHTAVVVEGHLVKNIYHCST